MSANSKGRMSSIARKIHRAWSWKLLRTYLLIDLVVIVLALGGFFYAAERNYPGGFNSEGIKRITAGDGALDWLEQETAGGRETLRKYIDMDSWHNAASSLTYHFMDASGAWHEKPMGPFLEVFALMFRNLLITEAVLWVLTRLFGGGDARRLLRPLTRMTETAQQLSEQQADKSTKFSEDRLHNLEDAIGSLEPALSGARLSTGNQELKGLEEAVNRLLDRMQAAYREQSRFVSDASHELRTPIAVIQGYASMLDRWGKTDESILDESIAAIKSESEHMKELVEQLLFLARGDSGRQNTAFESFDLAATMREVFEESEMIDEGHDWRLEASERVPVVGDESMIKQAARILTDNAAKYTPAGGAIVIRAYEKNGAGAFEVQDSGQGIDAEDAQHIFERFYRADPARTGAAKDKKNAGSSGTGLGLSIAEWIIKRHGGYFEVLSWPGLGTRITAFLPPKPREV